MGSAKERMLRGYQRIYGEEPQIKEYQNIPSQESRGKITQADIDAELRRRKVIR